MEKTSFTKIASVLTILLVLSSNYALFAQNQDSVKTVFVPQKAWYSFVQNYKNIEVSPEKADWYKDKTITFLFSFTSSNLLQLEEVTGVTDPEVLDALFAMPIEATYSLQPNTAFAVKMLNEQLGYFDSVEYYKAKGIESFQAEPSDFALLNINGGSFEWTLLGKQGTFLGIAKNHFAKGYGGQLNLGITWDDNNLSLGAHALYATLLDTVFGNFELPQREYGVLGGLQFNYERILRMQYQSQFRFQSGISYSTINIFEGETQREKDDDKYNYIPFEGVMFIGGVHFLHALGKPKYNLKRTLLQQPYIDFFATIQPYFLKTKGLRGSIYTLGFGLRFERTGIKSLILN